ncbi:hypothetical protein [Pseudomonas sp.]|uniref:hypothetical protein n=1 Tax=Pseudomonas sp. TaxID=306 RepID=UPI003263A2E2
MKWLCYLCLLASLCLGTAQATPFYEGKPLAHPVIDSLQDSQATLAFIKETKGVTGYYCLCQNPDRQPQALDTYGDASIEAVFNTALDNEHTTMLVLFKVKNRYGIRAYRFSDSPQVYVRLTRLQPALDRIAKDQKNLNAVMVRKALAKLSPFDYRIDYEESGITEFDQIDHTAGTLVSYFDDQKKPVPDDPASDSISTYKKTFQKKDGRFLTVTYWRGADKAVRDYGDRTAYNYQIYSIAWETGPAQYDATRDGYAVTFSSGLVRSIGQYKNNLRTGEWTFQKGWENRSSGAYADGKRQGRWSVWTPEELQVGNYENDLREGRWRTSPPEDDEPESYGFVTYLHDQRQGPSERRSNGVVIERGDYQNDKRQGAWLTEAGEGAYENGLQSGPWILRTKEGHTQRVNFIDGKKEGELRDADASGTLTLEEHYKANVLAGAREGYAANGKPTFREQYENGKPDGPAQHFSADGSRLIKEMTWRDGVLDGPYRDYLDDGTLASEGAYADGKFVGTWMDRDAKGAVALETTSCSFDENGPKIGLCGKFRVFKQGKLQSESEYLYGHRQNYVEYNVETGKKTQELIIGKDDQVTVNNYGSDGGWCTLAKKGFRLMTINQQPVKDYDGAELYGEQLCFYPNGVVSSRYFFDRGFLGCTVNYDETGKEIPERCAPPTPEMEKRMQKFIH